MIYIPLILIPMAGLVLFTVRSVAGEQDRLRRERELQARQQLVSAASVLYASRELLEGEILLWRDLADADSETIRARGRNCPFARQVFLLDGQGVFLYPAEGDRSDRDEAFFNRTRALWSAGVTFQYRNEEGTARESGWYPYYEGNTVSWIYWLRTADGRILGFDLFREYVLDRLLRSFRESLPGGETDPARMILYDEFGRVIVQGGDHSPADNQRPLALLPLEDPFGGWRLELYRPEQALSPTGGVLPLILTAAALALALLAAAFVVIRETTREVRDARKKVSFVHQVSHELKTPLTNIRMYAEMLEARSAEGSPERRYSAVLVRESERLGRMIGNVLTFSRDSVKPRPVPCVPDELIARVLEAARPRLADKALDLEFRGGAGESVLADGDMLQQIVWNLISNGEKYGAGGGWIGVESGMEGDLLTVEVADRGPGIPAQARKAVFRPFFRVRDDITEGVSGAGLGLAISRDLARKHGGDLVLLATETGARFRLTLKTEPAGGAQP